MRAVVTNARPSVRWTPEEVKALRLKLGWTQFELAEAIHAREHTVGRWESPSGHRPSRVFRERLNELASSLAAASEAEA